MLEELSNLTYEMTDISVYQFLLNMIIGLVLSIALKYHYRKYSIVLSNKEEFSQVFPFIVLTILFIITIVKSSLALSLGLVGALSIVRFRTPIKEPEELAYLFVAISIGLGLGANQILISIVSTVFVLFVMAILNNKTNSNVLTKNIYMTINMTPSSANFSLSNFNKLVAASFIQANMKRADVSDSNVNITYLINIKQHEEISSFIEIVGKKYDGIKVSVFDNRNIPGV
jgi:hypothetical protein